MIEDIKMYKELLECLRYLRETNRDIAMVNWYDRTIGRVLMRLTEILESNMAWQDNTSNTNKEI